MERYRVVFVFFLIFSENCGLTGTLQLVASRLNKNRAFHPNLGLHFSWEMHFSSEFLAVPH